MAITNKNGETSYIGQVIRITDHMWMDGMLDEYAVVWDMDEHTTKHIQVGYYGCDGQNMMDTNAKVDMTAEVARDIKRTLKRESYRAFEKSVNDYKKEIRKGSNVEVVRGRKVAKGTKLNVFWVGEKETYKSRQYSWMHETELIAGCYNEAGEKVWIKAEYLKVTDTFKSPNRHEREKFIKDYVRRHYSEIVR